MKVDLYNDHNYGGWGHGRQDGDKLYAATGLGWDDYLEGWHHCPPGMGLYGKVFIEERNPVHLTDLYVRPMVEEQKAEVWAEINCSGYPNIKEFVLRYSIYGQNFNHTVCKNVSFTPSIERLFGFGDVVSEYEMEHDRCAVVPLRLGHGLNVVKFTVDMPDARLWSLDAPWLYQLQLAVEIQGQVTDTAKCQFGMRSFTQDLASEKKGMFYLNGKKIRLRGANTMGFEQQDVLREDYEQLIEDILLAKLCNMNFLRFTQRPVQDEVYEYCDKLGLMTQSDLPLFGAMRRTKVAEGVRQTEEMVKMVRKHPCNVMITYINEPGGDCYDAPSRFLKRDELQAFFEMCDRAAKLMNPDQVIKHVDGDYDPPSTNMPDYHCYAMWYTGHGLDFGRIHKGHWLPVLPGWYYGCGEFGAEGLDSLEVIRECYPKEWLKEPFDPRNIIKCQVGECGMRFYDEQDSMEAWVEETQRHQAFSNKWLTEAFRRNNNMVSCAIHLFIDAWPSGWMKTIMDCKRIPKKSYFAYRDALQPKLLSLRTDRLTYFAGEPIAIECFLCNDTNDESKDYRIVYELYRGGKKIQEGIMPAELKDCSAGYSSECCFTVENVDDRETVTVRAVLLDDKGTPVSENTLEIEVFEDVELPKQKENCVLLTNLERGTYEIAGETVVIIGHERQAAHFVSRKTGHPAVAEFKPQDFAYWYDKKEDMITPVAKRTFEAEGFTPILMCQNRPEQEWSHRMMPVCAEKYYEGKRYIICTLDLRTENPVAKRFLRNLLAGE